MHPDRFRRTRDDHRQETAEDYVELIDALITECGEARAVNLAKRFGVSHATVAKTLQRLQRDGLVTFQPYRSIFLTTMGSQMAELARNRHSLVFEFLRTLGVDEAVAEADAEGLEHHLSQATLDAMALYIRNQKA